MKGPWQKGHRDSLPSISSLISWYRGPFFCSYAFAVVAISIASAVGFGAVAHQGSFDLLAGWFGERILRIGVELSWSAGRTSSAFSVGDASASVIVVAVAAAALGLVGIAAAATQQREEAATMAAAYLAPEAAADSPSASAAEDWSSSSHIESAVEWLWQGRIACPRLALDRIERLAVWHSVSSR